MSETIENIEEIEDMEDFENSYDYEEENEYWSEKEKRYIENLSWEDAERKRMRWED